MLTTAQSMRRPLSRSRIPVSSVQVPIVAPAPPDWARRLRSLSQTERWVVVGDQHQGIGSDPVVPTDNAFDEVEHALWVPAGEQNGEPGEDHDHEGCDP